MTRNSLSSDFVTSMPKHSFFTMPRHFANKLIKSLLGQAAQIARIHNPEIREYYERLRTKGKKHSVAINNVKNKLLRIIVALVKKRTFYDSESYKFYRDRLNAQFKPS